MLSLLPPDLRSLVGDALAPRRSAASPLNEADAARAVAAALAGRDPAWLRAAAAARLRDEMPGRRRGAWWLAFLHRGAARGI